MIDWNVINDVIKILLGGVLVAMGNYLLQKWSFNAQNEANQRNSRISAYNTLLGHIMNYEADKGRIMNCEADKGDRYIFDMGLWLTQVFSFSCNQEIRDQIEPLLKKKLERSPELDTKLIGIKKAIVEEIKKEKAKSKHWYQFWK